MTSTVVLDHLVSFRKLMDVTFSAFYEGLLQRPETPDEQLEMLSFDEVNQLAEDLKKELLKQR